MISINDVTTHYHHRSTRLFTRKSAYNPELTRLVRKYADSLELSITMTSHTLRSALAMLTGYDISEWDHVPKVTKQVWREHTGGSSIDNLRQSYFKSELL